MNWIQNQFDTRNKNRLERTRISVNMSRAAEWKKQVEAKGGSIYYINDKEVTKQTADFKRFKSIVQSSLLLQQSEQRRNESHRGSNGPVQNVPTESVQVEHPCTARGSEYSRSSQGSRRGSRSSPRAPGGIDQAASSRPDRPESLSQIRSFSSNSPAGPDQTDNFLLKRLEDLTQTRNIPQERPESIDPTRNFSPLPEHLLHRSDSPPPKSLNYRNDPPLPKGLIHRSDAPLSKISDHRTDPSPPKNLIHRGEPLLSKITGHRRGSSFLTPRVDQTTDFLVAVPEISDKTSFFTATNDQNFLFSAPEISDKTSNLLLTASEMADHHSSSSPSYRSSSPFLTPERQTCGSAFRDSPPLALAGSSAEPFCSSVLISSSKRPEIVDPNSDFSFIMPVSTDNGVGFTNPKKGYFW